MKRFEIFIKSEFSESESNSIMEIFKSLPRKIIHSKCTSNRLKFIELLVNFYLVIESWKFSTFPNLEEKLLIKKRFIRKIVLIESFFFERFDSFGRIKF